MKKLMTVAALVASALVFTGCGGKPKIPANTVAAAYVDLDNLVGNAFDVVDDAIDEIPNKEKRKEMREEFKKFVKDHKPDFKAIDLDWAVFTLGIGEKDKEEIALVIKCDCKKKIPTADASVSEMVKGMGGGKTISSGEKYETYKVNLGGMMFMPIPNMPKSFFVTVAKDQYVILTVDEDVMKKMVDLYANGKGETSDDFDDLADVSSDTIIRIQTAEAETFAKLAGVKEFIENYCKEAGDEDMADLLLDVENLTRDINFSDDIVGAVLTVDAGSRELAKVVESAFNVVAFASRLGVDLVAGNPEGFRSKFGCNSISKDAFAKMVKAVAEEVRDGVEADRSGSTATLTLELDTDDLLEAVVPALFE